MVVCQRADAERFTGSPATPRSCPGRPPSRTARPGWRGSRPGCRWWPSRSVPTLIHSPYYTMPLHAPVPVVVTMHDVTFFSEPELHSAVQTGFYRSATRTAVRRAARVVVPSQATRDELVRLLDADADRIDVARHGVDTHDVPPAERDRDAAGHRPARPARPAVRRVPRRPGAPQERARPGARLGQGRRRPDEPPALVLAGSSGWDDGVDQAIAEVPAHLKVVRPGFLRPADLPGLLGGAMVVAYPSKAEGFGLPVLEAMACGAAVLTARRLSLPEVGGDAVAYTEPDADSIAESLRRADRRRAAARQLSLSGQERAREFTWEASAQAHLETYAGAGRDGAGRRRR